MSPAETPLQYETANLRRKVGFFAGQKCACGHLFYFHATRSDGRCFARIGEPTFARCVCVLARAA